MSTATETVEVANEAQVSKLKQPYRADDAPLLTSVPTDWDAKLHKMPVMADFSPECKHLYYEHRAIIVQAKIDAKLKAVNPDAVENRKKFVAEKIRIYSTALEEKINPRVLELRAQIDDLQGKINVAQAEPWEESQAQGMLDGFRKEEKLLADGKAAPGIEELEEQLLDWKDKAELAKTGKMSSERSKRKKLDKMAEQFAALAKDVGGVDVDALLKAALDAAE